MLWKSYNEIWTTSVFIKPSYCTHPTGVMVAEHSFNLCSAVVQQVYSDMDSQMTGDHKHSAELRDPSGNEIKEKTDNRNM